MEETFSTSAHAKPYKSLKTL